jgi:uncharacterized protein (DUF2062 family)
MLKEKFIGFLKQGLSPEKLALCVALGSVIGVFPAIGTTTLLCAFAAWLLRLNQPAIQTVNYVVYPLQFALLIPFYRLGEWLFRVPKLEITARGVKTLIHSGVFNAIHVLWDTTPRAIVAWMLVAPFAIALLYVALVPLFRRLNTERSLG